jgi:hypothetical protein
VLLVGFQLPQALSAVQGAAERHRELVAVGMPALGGMRKLAGSA